MSFIQWYKQNPVKASILTMLALVGLMATVVYLVDHIENWKWVN